MAEQQHTDSDKDSAAGSNVSTSGPGRPKIESIVVFDTEASGLPRPGRSTKITELCLLCVLTDEIRTPERLPRVMNKLQLCFNPKQCIEPSASTVTGLYNDVLEHMPTFQEQASLIASFLISQPSPTCIIAHNGHGFDFPLLMQELEKAGVSLLESTAIYCADSLEAFRMLDGLPAKPEWMQKKAEKGKHAILVSRSSCCSPVKVVETREQKKQNGLNFQMNELQNLESDAQSRSSRDAEDGWVVNVKGEGIKVNCGLELTELAQIVNHAQVQNYFTSSETVASMYSMSPKISSSQSSITDSELIAACEEVEKKVLMEDMKKETFSEESGSSACSAELCHSQWSQNETTPTKVASTSEISRTDFSKQLRKRRKSLPNEDVRKQGSKVVRRLFEDSNEKAKTESEGFSATVDHEISSDESDAEDPWHGSTPDEEFVALAVEAEAGDLWKESVTSLGSETDEGSAGSAQKRAYLGKEAFEGDAVKSQSISFVPHEDPGTQQVVISSETKNNEPPDRLVKIRKSNYWYKKPTVSYKLGEIYRRVFKEYPRQAHTAEGDCLALLKLIHNKAPQFLAWLEENAVLLSSHSCTLHI